MAAPFSLVPLVGSPEAPVSVSSLNFHLMSALGGKMGHDAPGMFHFNQVGEQLEADAGLPFTGVPQPVPDLEGAFGQELAGSDPPGILYGDFDVRVSHLETARGDLDRSAVSVVPIENEHMPEALAVAGIQDVPDQGGQGFELQRDRE